MAAPSKSRTGKFTAVEAFAMIYSGDTQESSGKLSQSYLIVFFKERVYA